MHKTDSLIHPKTFKYPEAFKYLEASKYIDCDNSDILALARELAGDSTEPEEISRRCFDFVKDEIKHSWDYQAGPVTVIASQVLMHGTGYCYAKSHLLAALLRANKIPAGLCYQRLEISEGDFCLHGLNAVYLESHGWYRLDPRGDKPGVSSSFMPPVESLAFKDNDSGEIDSKSVYAEPLACVVNVLESAQSIEQVEMGLPDLDRF